MKDTILTFFMGMVLLIIMCAVSELTKHLRTSSQIRRINWSKANLSFDYFNSLCFNFAKTQFHFNYEQDKEYVNAIIDDFNSRMQTAFFKGGFPYNKKLHRLSDEEFVILYLHSYLKNLSLNDKISGLEPIKYSHKEDKNTTVYTLTDSGYAFYRLLYTIEAYCKNNEKIMDTGLCHLNTCNHEKVLNSGTYTSYGL